jgi:mevalonate kinase
MTVTATAQGKLILFGEHAVVYGYPCIGIAINRQISVTASKTVDKDLFSTPGVKNNVFVEQSLAVFRNKFGINAPVSILTNSTFTDKLGLGSSSAVTVATISALSKLFKKNLSKKELFNLSFEAVLSVQGVGSGFDIAAAVYGGCLYYEKKGEIIEPIKTEAPPLLVIYSGIKADTTTLIKKVREKYNHDQKNTEKIFDDITNIVKNAHNAYRGREEKVPDSVGKIKTHKENRR